VTVCKTLYSGSIPLAASECSPRSEALFALYAGDRGWPPDATILCLPRVFCVLYDLVMDVAGGKHGVSEVAEKLAGLAHRGS